MTTKAKTTPLTAPITALFTAHPAAVNETYFEHMGFALRFFGMLSLAAGAALVHAIIPALCEKTASTIIRKLFAKIEHRH